MLVIRRLGFANVTTWYGADHRKLPVQNHMRASTLSAFRPFFVLKGGPLGTGRGAIRQGLVILQFAVLAALGIGAGVLLMQYRFALNRTMEHADRVLFVAVPKCE